MTEALSTPAAAGVPVLTVAGPCATIRFRRPAVHNRIEPIDLETLSNLFNQIEADTTLRVAVFTATGRSFSSGFHIGEMGGLIHAADHSFERIADLAKLQLDDAKEDLEEAEKEEEEAKSGGSSKATGSKSKKATAREE